MAQASLLQRILATCRGREFNTIDDLASQIPEAGYDVIETTVVGAIRRGLLHGRINELTPEHMIGLRFASDAELPELVRQALGGTLTTTKSVKQAVKDWQADHLRV